MALKDLFAKKNTTDNPAGSCCNVEIVPDDRPEKSDARPQTSSTASRDTPEASDNST
ncbi:hypothetical protein AALF15_13400 [Corynebacteriaceae bacterium 7-707]